MILKYFSIFPRPLLNYMFKKWFLMTLSSHSAWTWSMIKSMLRTNFAHMSLFSAKNGHAHKARLIDWTFQVISSRCCFGGSKTVRSFFELLLGFNLHSEDIAIRYDNNTCEDWRAHPSAAEKSWRSIFSSFFVMVVSCIRNGIQCGQTAERIMCWWNGNRARAENIF